MEAEKIRATAGSGRAARQRSHTAMARHANVARLLAPLVVLLAMGSSAERASAVPTESEVRAKLTGLDVPFMGNGGQADARVAFYAQTFAGTVFVTKKGEIVYSLPGPAKECEEKGPGGGVPRQRSAAERHEPGWTMVERFGGGRPRPHAEAPSPTNVSSFVGTDPGRWRPQVQTYGGVHLGEVWPGIEVSLRASGRNVEKVYRVGPGVSAKQIRMEVAGAKSLRLAENGALIAMTGPGEVRLHAPLAFEDRPDGRVSVEVAYQVEGSRYGFVLGRHDPRYPVIIDPLLQATYLGGSGPDLPWAMVVTGSDVFVAGDTYSADFPGTTGGAQAGSGGGTDDAFVARLDLALTTLSQTTYLGGSGNDAAFALVVTGTEIFVAGQTSSSDFPGTAGGAQASIGGGSAGDVFIARLSLALTTLSQATYLGGSLNDSATALSVTGSEVFVAGVTASANFPGTAGGAQTTRNGGTDAFVARLDLALTTLSQATYLGGSAGGSYADEIQALVVTGSDVFVAGETESGDFPGTAGGAQTSNMGSADAFVAKLDLALTTLSQATYLGGSSFDEAYALVVTGTEIFVAGKTNSSNFPGTAGGAQPSLAGPTETDGFIARLNLPLTTLSQATYLGGNGASGDAALALFVTGSEVFVAGVTGSGNFPGTAGGAQNSLAGSYDAFVARLNLALTSLSQATYLGGIFVDYATALSVTGGEVFIAGPTSSYYDFPGTTGGAQPNGAGDDGFVARLTSDLTGTTTTTMGGGGTTSTTTSTTSTSTTIPPGVGHLKCYGAKDARPKAAYTLDLIAGVGGFPNELGCSLKLGAKSICVEVDKQNASPPAPGGGPPIPPNASSIFLSYKVKCPKQSAAPVALADQFGAGSFSRGTVSELLVPARKTLGDPANDHFECFRAKDARLTVSYTMDLIAGVSGFVDETGCTVNLGATEVCVQVTKQNVAPPPPGGGPGPGPNSGAKFIAYKLKCPKGVLPSFGIDDQFGGGTLTPKKTPKMLLVPAQ